MSSDYTTAFLADSIEIVRRIDKRAIDEVAELIAATKLSEGRLFLAGSGGGAGHASHATADFRKIAGIESYCISDNVSELTARINDDSWDDAYSGWLIGSRIRAGDCLLVFSVGGGDVERRVSTNLVNAIDTARRCGASVVGIAGRDGGYLARVANACVLVPTINPSHVTTQTEGFQALIWHLIVGHPVLGSATPKWESLAK